MNRFKVHNEKSLVNLSNSILKHFGANYFHESIPEIDNLLKGHDKVVAVLFDGMGQNITRLHLKENSYIRSNYSCRYPVNGPNSVWHPDTGGQNRSVGRQDCSTGR